jgi:alpha-mannosidase
MGYSVYQLKAIRRRLSVKALCLSVMADGKYLLETDLYKIIIDPAHGGVIKSIIAKTLNGKQFVDQTNRRCL